MLEEGRVELGFELDVVDVTGDDALEVRYRELAQKLYGASQVKTKEKLVWAGAVFRR